MMVFNKMIDDVDGDGDSYDGSDVDDVGDGDVDGDGVG